MKYLDNTGLAYLWNKIKSIFVSHSELEQSELDLESQILLPNFDNLTPISTIELDTASTSYYQIFTRENTNISSDMSDVNDIVLFRITTTGTGIYAVDDFIVRFQNGLTYPQVVGTANTFSVSAATTGLYYIRFNHPKTLNSGYPWVCDFRTYNATARHIKIEVFSTTDKVTWMDSLTATTFNSTYQTDSSSMALYDRRGVVHNGTFYGAAYSANTASYENYYHAKYFNSSIVRAGDALSVNYILYVNNGCAYRVSNKDNSIDPEFGINICSGAYAVGSFIATAPYFAQQKQTVPISADADTTYDPINVGDKVYLRCRLVGDKIYSDGHLSTSMSAGYTWYLIGAAYSTTNISFSTIGSMFITLDENGMVSHINGKPTQTSLMTGSYKRLVCGAVESDTSSSAKLESVKGNSVVFNQIVNNGDFSNGITGWTYTGSGASYSITDNVLSVSSTAGTGNFGPYTNTSSNAAIKKDHKYFYSIYAKASANMTAYAPYFRTSSPVPTRLMGAGAPNQLTTEWQRFTGVILATGDTYAAFGVRNYTSIGAATIYIKNAMMIDLTKMFGTGNEPQDMELLKQMFPLDYYDYNVDGTLLGGTETGFKSSDSSSTTLTELSIPITTLTGKPVGSNTSEVMFPDGLNGIGDVRDEIDFANGTTVKRIGKVDLGTLTWTKNSGTQYYATLSDIKSTASTLNTNILCERYISANSYSGGVDKAICGYSGSHLIWLQDSSYSDASTLTTSLDGVYIHYELDNPIEYTIDTVPTVSYTTEIGGTEKWLPINTSIPTVAPIYSISTYKSGTYKSGDGINISDEDIISVNIDLSNANGLSVGSNGISLSPAIASTNGSGGSSGAISATDKEKLDNITSSSYSVFTSNSSGLVPSASGASNKFLKGNGTWSFVDKSWTSVSGTSEFISDKPPIVSGTGKESIVANALSDNYSSGYYSHSEGYSTLSIGDNSHSEGCGESDNFDVEYDSKHEIYSIIRGDLPVWAYFYTVVVFRNKDVVQSSYITEILSSNTFRLETPFSKFISGEVTFYSLAAIGDNSHSEGYSTLSIGDNSHSEGSYTIAQNDSEHSEGIYNISNTGLTKDLQTLHSVGIGSSNVSRSNAIEIMKNGDLYVNGVGGYDGTNTSQSSTLQDVINGTIQVKEYSSYTCSANDTNNGYVFFMNVVPTSDNYYDTWYVRYKLYITTSEAQTQGWYDCYVSTAGGTIIYAVFNNFASTSYYPIYYHLLMWYQDETKYASREDNPMKIGVRLQSARTPTTLARNFRIEIIETYRCDVSFPNSIEKYADIWDTTKYTITSTIDATTRGLVETGDTTDTTTIQLSYTSIDAGAGGVMMYSLIMEDGTGKWQSFTTTSGNGTSKTKNTCGFKLGSNIYYVAKSTDTTANSHIGNWTVRYHASLVDFRYSLNIANTAGNGLLPYLPVYIVGTIGQDGLFYLDNTWWTQTIPTTDDNKIYIKFCEAPYSEYANDRNYRGDLIPDGTPMCFKNGKFRQYNFAYKDEIIDLFDNITETNGSQYVNNGVLTVSSGQVNIIPNYLPTVVNHGTSDTTLSITPNVLHVWGEVSTLTLTLATPGNANIYNEYMFQFESGSTPTTLTNISGVSWIGGTPVIQPNKIYQASIVNNIGIIGGV